MVVCGDCDVVVFDKCDDGGDDGDVIVEGLVCVLMLSLLLLC